MLFVEEARPRYRTFNSSYMEIHQIEGLCLTGMQKDWRGRVIPGKKKTLSCLQPTATRALRSLFVRKQTRICHFTRVRVRRNGPATLWKKEREAIVCCAGPVMLSLLIYWLGYCARSCQKRWLHSICGGQLEGSGFVAVCICTFWVCCFTLQGEITFDVMTFLPGSVGVWTPGLWLLW